MRETAALLTPTQRQYLTDPEEADIDVGGAAERMNRMRIRERALHGILDFQHLLKQDPKDRRQVFEKSERQRFLEGTGGRTSPSSVGGDDDNPNVTSYTDVPEKTPSDELLSGLTDTIAYIYLGLLDRGMSKDGIENLFAKGISTAVVQAGGGERLPDIDVEISVDYPSDRNAEELISAFLDGEDLTREERELVLEHGPGLPLQKAFQDMADEKDE